jgi:hypothetical protein
MQEYAVTPLDEREWVLDACQFTDTGACSGFSRAVRNFSEVAS